MPKKFNLEFSKNNPFLLKKNSGSRTWDIIYENYAYDVKTRTFEDYTKLLDITTDNRDLISYIFMVCVADIPNMNKDLNFTTVYFIQSLFNRMLKTSKVIQDLIVQGSHIEAKCLLRANFERGVQLEYFLGRVDELKDYLNALNNDDKKRLREYSIFKLVEHLKKDYDHYKYLCQFVHPYMHEEDANLIDFGDGNTAVLMKAYNEYDYKTFMWIIYQSNNILLEVFFNIFEYLKSYVPKEELEDENLKNIFDDTKKLLFISLAPQENKENTN